MNSEFVQLKWNAHHSAFLQSLSSLRDKQVYTDVTLSCGSQFYPAHRLVLSSCSTFLAQALEVATSTAPVVLLHGINQSTLEHLLLFMYDGQVTIAREELPGLLRAAHWLGVKGLESTYDGLGNENMEQIAHTVKTLLSSIGDESSESIVESIMDLMVQTMQKSQKEVTNDSEGGEVGMEDTQPTQKNKNTQIDNPALEEAIDCCPPSKQSQEASERTPTEQKSYTDGSELFEKNVVAESLEEEDSLVSSEKCCSFRHSMANGGSGLEEEEQGEEGGNITTPLERTVQDADRGGIGETETHTEEDVHIKPSDGKKKESEKSLKKSKRGLRCRHCRKFFLVRAELAKHMRISHVDFIHNMCHICNVSFLTSREYNAHLKLHRIGEVWHQCDKCEFVTNKKRTLQKHQHTIHLSTTFHAAAHHDTPQCSQKKEVLTSQMDTESSLSRGIMLPQVRIERLEDSNKKLALEKVQSLKDSTEVISCTTCGQKFRDNKKYEAHKLVSCYKIKQFKSVYHCPMCSYARRKKQAIFDHISSKHSRKLQFECSLCTFQANRKVLIRHHMAKRHGVLMATS